jgi:hypothetical protein
MSKRSFAFVVATLLFVPIGAFAQSGGGGGGAGGSGGGGAASSAGGAASGPTAGTPSAVGSPNAGSPGAGSASISGVPDGPANQGNNSVNDPSGAGNSAKVATAPGTNNLGTARSLRDRLPVHQVEPRRQQPPVLQITQQVTKQA